MNDEDEVRVSCPCRGRMMAEAQVRHLIKTVQWFCNIPLDVMLQNMHLQLIYASLYFNTCFSTSDFVYHASIRNKEGSR